MSIIWYGEIRNRIGRVINNIADMRVTYNTDVALDRLLNNSKLRVSTDGITGEGL